MKSDSGQLSLLFDRRLGPLFITQFLGAFNDNLFKNALVVLLLYSAALQSDLDPKILVTIATGIFILPYVLFSATGGQLADKFPKHLVIRALKIAEMGIGFLGMAALLAGSLTLSFAVLFALGAQSAFFAPSKYSILPQHLGKHELIAGNALLNTGTFLAILFGTLTGTMLVTYDQGTILVGALMICCAGAGYLSSRFVPFAEAKEPDLHYSFNPLRTSLPILRCAFSQPKPVTRSIFGIAWFYFLGSMFISQFPNFTRETLEADEQVLAFFLIVFSVGIAGGGLFNHYLLKGRISGRFVPYAMAGVSVFSFDLFFAGHAAHRMEAQQLLTITQLFSSPAHWRIIFDVAMIALCGGLFVVPLNAMVQHHTPETMRARILAGSGILDALFIVASSAIAAFLIGRGADIPGLFLSFAAANAAVSIYFFRIVKIVS